MPEGPEARTVGDKLRPYLVNATLTAIVHNNKGKLMGFEHLVLPATVVSVTAYGKKVVIILNNDANIITSLGMSGRLQFVAGNHSNIRLDFNTTLSQVISVYFDDSRHFGNIEIIPALSVPNYFAALGPDLLEHSLDEKTWITLPNWLTRYKTQRPSTKAICNMLEDQKRIAGMGWYIITEVLYYSGVHPERQVQTITTEEWDRIRINAHRVIRLSYYYGGFTIKDYISPDGTPGTYPSAIYGKTHDPLGNVVEHKPFKSSRTIHYVTAIQQ